MTKRAHCHSFDFRQGGVTQPTTSHNGQEYNIVGVWGGFWGGGKKAIPAVAQTEGEDTIDVGDLEGGLEGGALALSVEESSDVGIQHHKLELDILSGVRNPLFTIPLLNINKIFLQKNRN